MRNRFPIAILLILSCTTLSGCFLFAKKAERAEEFGAKKRDKEAAVVRAIAVRKEVTPRLIEATISMEGQKQVDVYSRVAGRLSSIQLRDGEPVKQGQILFKVDRTDPGENFLATPVESPVQGWIARWNATVGTQVTTQTPVVQIVDDRILHATVSLPSSDWALISPRTEVVIESGAQSRKAHINSIARAADPTSGRGSFEISIENNSRNWRAGTNATAKIKLDPKARMLLPAQALILTDLGAVVYVVENDIAIRKPVQYEMLSNDVVEITSGLGTEAVVVTSGNNVISNRSPVRILDESKKDEGESNSKGNNKSGGDRKPQGKVAP
jgi:multidrug efflux pump subunit AcrA (membrane-fusion protein)